MNWQSGPSKSRGAVGKQNLGRQLCPTCCGFFLLIWATPVLFLLFYADFPKTVCIIVLIILFSGLTPILIHDGQLVRSADSSGAMLSMILTASCMLAAAGGLHSYYAYVQPLVALQSMRTYTNVYPQQPGLAFNDAAFLEFASSTSVDVSKAVSFKSLSTGTYTFCAAPIVDAQNTGHIEFWAVGVDCCGAAGDFHCDSAGEAGPQKGWIMRDPSENDVLYEWLGKYLVPPEIRRDVFVQTIHKAEGMYEITAGAEPVLVRWTSKSKDELTKEEGWSIASSFLTGCLSAGLAAIALTMLYQRYSSVHHLHDRLSLGNVQFHQPSVQTARILEFFQRITNLEQIPLPPIKYEDVCLMSVVLPYLVLLSSLLIWSFAYCSRFGNWIVTPYLVLLLVLVSVLLTTPQRCVQGVLVLTISLVGTYIGCFNWDNNVFHYCSVESHRSYSNVVAAADAHEYMDAGKLHFQDSARLVNEWSVGFKHDGDFFCVAPIVACSDQGNPSSTEDVADDASEETSGDAPSEALSLIESKAKRSRRRFRLMSKERGSTPLALLGDSSGSGRHATADSSRSADMSTCKLAVPSQVDFWAVGKNCCKPSGDFWCSDVEDASAKSAVVVYAFHGQDLDKRHPWKQYQLAVRKAADSFNLPFPDHPMLLKWGRDVDRLYWEWMSKAIGIVILTSIAGMLAILGVATLSYCSAKQQRRKEAKERQAMADPSGTGL